LVAQTSSMGTILTTETSLWTCTACLLPKLSWSWT
jgi:hypothetical protein